LGYETIGPYHDAAAQVKVQTTAQVRFGLVRNATLQRFQEAQPAALVCNSEQPVDPAVGPDVLLSFVLDPGGFSSVSPPVTTECRLYWYVPGSTPPQDGWANCEVSEVSSPSSLPPPIVHGDTWGYCPTTSYATAVPACGGPTCGVASGDGLPIADLCGPNPFPGPGDPNPKTFEVVPDKTGVPADASFLYL
jgi:hypothetical protein